MAMVIVVSFGAFLCTAQSVPAECNPAPISIPLLTKSVDGWDMSFTKEAKATKNVPYILSDGKDTGFRYVEYEPKKQVITLPHIEVNPCNHTGTIDDWHLVPMQVVGFEKNGHVFAYRVWGRRVSGPSLDSQALASNTHVTFYDMHGDGIFDSVRLGDGIEPPSVPDWVVSAQKVKN
jgi:hypothetical protein